MRYQTVHTRQSQSRKGTAFQHETAMFSWMKSKIKNCGILAVMSLTIFIQRFRHNMMWSMMWSIMWSYFYELKCTVLLFWLQSIMYKCSCWLLSLSRYSIILVFVAERFSFRYLSYTYIIHLLLWTLFALFTMCLLRRWMLKSFASSWLVQKCIYFPLNKTFIFYEIRMELEHLRIT